LRIEAQRQVKNAMISVGTTFNYDIPLKRQLPMIREAGFTHISLGSEKPAHSGYLTRTGQKNLLRMLDHAGLRVCSLHAPYHKYADISSPRKEVASRALALFKRCIDAAAFLKARAVIFHATPCLKITNPASRKKILFERLSALLEYIGGDDVHLAVENLFSQLANEILSYSLDTIASRNYGLCYDSSHANLLPQPLAILRKYAHRLLTTHISDNRGKKDDHILPFEGTYRWDAFCAAFSEIKFGGIFLLEVEMRESAFKSPQEFLKETFRRGRKLLKQSGKI
jgi:sugar phosphate isomerase/epimerase